MDVFDGASETDRRDLWVEVERRDLMDPIVSVETLASSRMHDRLASTARSLGLIRHCGIYAVKQQGFPWRD